jgi:hypothetical protein
MTLRRWLGFLLLLVAVLGCSSSASAQPSAPPPAQISPAWTAVRIPDGSNAYIADLCFDNSWVILTSAEGWGHWWSLNAAYGGKC